MIKKDEQKEEQKEENDNKLHTKATEFIPTEEKALIPKSSKSSKSSKSKVNPTDIEHFLTREKAQKMMKQYHIPPPTNTSLIKPITEPLIR